MALNLANIVNPADVQSLLVDILGDLADGDIDKPETAAEIRTIAKTFAASISSGLSAKYGFAGLIAGMAFSHFITDAAEKFIKDKTAVPTAAA